MGDVELVGSFTHGVSLSQSQTARADVPQEDGYLNKK